MMFESLDEKKGELAEFIKGYGFPLNCGEFEEFKEVFLKERIRLLGSHKADNLGSGRKVPAIRSINKRLKEFNVGLEIVRENDIYYLKDI